MEIRNKQGELLETLIEGAPVETADKILLMVHGIGTNLHERGLFDDIVPAVTKKLPCLCTIRFSWPGFGTSEGVQEETNLYKVGDCITFFLDYILENKQPNAEIIIFAHSMGNQALTYALKEKDYPISLYIAECPSVYREGNDVFEKWKKRPNTIVDKNSVLITPRADGTTTRIGPSYWKSISLEAYKEHYPKIVAKYNSVLIRALEDAIVDNSILKELPYREIVELHGGHGFPQPADRKVFLKKLIEVIND